MTKTALITGASSGIGRELARIHASKKGDLVIVARRLDQLRALKSELEQAYGVSVHVIQADLADPEAARSIYEETTKLQIKVDYLINNAGFGLHGKFHEGDLKKYESMIGVNLSALTALNYLYLQDMTARKDGKILNVASVAGFVPGPLLAVYFATKAYVLSLSQALAEELSESPITVTALCPGPVGTEFFKVGNAQDVRMLTMGVADAREVAEKGYAAMLKGKTVQFDGWKYNLLVNWILPFIPRVLIVKIARLINSNSI